MFTFPSPKKDKRFSIKNQYGVPDNVFQAIVKQTQILISQMEDSAEELTDAANISTDASLANNFYVTLGGNRNMSNPTNPQNWKVIRYYISQDGTGSRTLTWDTSFRFSTGIPSPTLTTTAYYSDYIEFIYNPTYSTWDCINVIKGFDTVPL